MNGDFEGKPKFEFKTGDACLMDSTCLTIKADNESIAFDGKLTAVPTVYTVTLKDQSTFIFTFGKMITTPGPTTTPATMKPETENPDPQPGPETDATQSQPEPVPPEPTNPSGETNTSEDNGDANGHETVPTTSSGQLTKASTTVLVMIIFAQYLLQ